MPDVPKIDPTRPWYSFAAAEAKGGKRVAKVQIYDAIGGWFGVHTSEFVKELNALDVDEIDLHLNSPGGAAFDGIAIHNALRQHKARVVATVDGLAASAASAIAMGADEVVMARGSQLMIHDGSAIAWGPAATMQKAADMLDKLSNQYAKIYAARAGGDAESWRAAMLAETWYSDDEAVAAGLADRTDSDDEADAEALAAHLSTLSAMAVFNYAGRGEAPPPMGVITTNTANAIASVKVTVAPAQQTPASTEPGYHKEQEEAPMSEFLTNLRARLGLNAEASEDDILAALETRQEPTATLPKGVVAIEQSVLDALRADAAAGRQAREDQITARRDQIIATALAEGRFTVPTAEAIRAQMDTDEAEAAAVKLIATFAKNAVPVTELGNGSDPEAESDDGLYARMFNTTNEEA